jgi:hypothetical protein
MVKPIPEGYHTVTPYLIAFLALLRNTMAWGTRA